MTILILKSTSPSSWYTNRVGEVLPVVRFEKNNHPAQGIPEDVYWCREGGKYNCLNYVRRSDATEIND